MSDRALGTATITQVGIIVRDIEARARAWADILGLPMPEIQVTDTVDVAQTEYRGSRSPARAKLAFFHMGQVDVELIEPVDGPSPGRTSSTSTVTACITSHFTSTACRRSSLTSTQKA